MKLTNLNNAPEIFYSLQGEGASMGTPTLFLRLAGCNLTCTWCDTAYSWKQTNAIELTAPQLKDIFAESQCHHLVITGGEPLLQEEEILAILPFLEDWYIEIESNGTICPSAELLERVNQWNISPKLFHSGNSSSKAICPEILQIFSKTYKAWFKFVVNHKSQWSEIEALHLPKKQIILMPQAKTKEELDLLRPLVAKLCLQHQVRLGERLHLTLWGTKKGV